MDIPFIFMRDIKCTLKNGLTPNVDNDIRRSFVVNETRYTDWKYYNSKWMDNEILPSNADTEIFIPDVDITEFHFIFDEDDWMVSLRQAKQKMSELWAKLIAVEIG